MISSLLTILIFSPVVFAVLLAFISNRSTFSIKIIALLSSFFSLFIAIYIAVLYNQGSGLYRGTTEIDWIIFPLTNGSVFRIQYALGLDGISLVLVLLNAFLLVIATILSWKIRHMTKGYFMLMMILSASLFGSFLALDFFLFYIFFELTLLPMFFLIGIWGGPRRSYASIKFFIYTLVGSLLILGAMIFMYLSSEVKEGGIIFHTFHFWHLAEPDIYPLNSLLHPDSTEFIWGFTYREWVFWLIIVGFLIKLPTVPLHTWLPDAHVEAPTAISVLLAGILLKLGGYGIIRIGYGLFPDVAANYAFFIGVLAVLSIVYAGWNALAQRDIKRMVAYSSVAHMGFVLLGLASGTTEGVQGALFQLISHGLLSAGLFVIAGVLYDRTHDRNIENYSGLAYKMPIYTFFTGIFFFASLGMPGLSGFVGEFLTLAGAFSSTSNISGGVAAFALFGILLSAAYFLWVLQRMFLGSYWVRETSWSGVMHDLTIREWLVLLPLAMGTVILGIAPYLVLDLTQEASEYLTQLLKKVP